MMAWELTINEHRVVYMTAFDWWCARTSDELDAWVSDDSFRRAMEGGTVCCLRWYPETPVVFEVRYAATVGELVEALPWLADAMEAR
jgi:hypothetical protein